MNLGESQAMAPVLSLSLEKGSNYSQNSAQVGDGVFQLLESVKPRLVSSQTGEVAEGPHETLLPLWPWTPWRAVPDLHCHALSKGAGLVCASAGILLETSSSPTMSLC